jgi:nucleoside 2-deoxyribosyltransferase
MLSKEDIKIYIAGKTWHGEKFRNIEHAGYNLISTWIHFPGQLKNREDYHPPAQLLNANEKLILWDSCLWECVNCDALVLYCEPEDKNTLSGALVEMGAATGAGKPIYCIGTCDSIQPNSNSDKAFTYQSLWHFVPYNDIQEGMAWVIEHYNEHYIKDWKTVREGKQLTIYKPEKNIVELFKDKNNPEHYYRK